MTKLAEQTDSRGVLFIKIKYKGKEGWISTGEYVGSDEKPEEPYLD